MSGPSGRVLIVGEFGAGALALAYARAFGQLQIAILGPESPPVT